jgi:hypothetical protein
MQTALGPRSKAVVVSTTPESTHMRTLSQQEVTQVAGGQPQLAVDVNIPAGYVHVNIMDGAKVILKLFNLDWSKLGTKA